MIPSGLWIYHLRKELKFKISVYNSLLSITFPFDHGFSTNSQNLHKEYEINFVILTFLKSLCIPKIWHGTKKIIGWQLRNILFFYRKTIERRPVRLRDKYTTQPFSVFSDPFSPSSSSDSRHPPYPSLPRWLRPTFTILLPRLLCPKVTILLLSLFLRSHLRLPENQSMTSPMPIAPSIFFPFLHQIGGHQWECEGWWHHGPAGIGEVSREEGNQGSKIDVVIAEEGEERRSEEEKDEAWGIGDKVEAVIPHRGGWSWSWQSGGRKVFPVGLEVVALCSSLALRCSSTLSTSMPSVSSSIDIRYQAWYLRYHPWYPMVSGMMIPRVTSMIPHVSSMILIPCGIRVGT